MRLAGGRVALRAVEPRDVELLYAWENDLDLWAVSGTTEPFSREQMARFVERQLEGADLLRTGQLRLMIEETESLRTIGAVDLFEYDPIHRRAGVGIVIYGEENRRKGYARETIGILDRYAREQLYLHQLWCTVGSDNPASLALFRQAGFVETGLRCDWWWTPEGYCDEVMLQKVLE